MITLYVYYLISPPGEIEPFFAAYPFVSTMDRDSAEFNVGEAFFAQYLLKVHPTTRGDYQVNIEPPAGAKVCALQITHVGSNMPCAEAPGATLTGYENVEIIYDSTGTEPNGCGMDTQVKFHVRLTHTHTHTHTLSVYAYCALRIAHCILQREEQLRVLIGEKLALSGSVKVKVVLHVVKSGNLCVFIKHYYLCMLFPR